MSKMVKSGMMMLTERKNANMINIDVVVCYIL
jgi:hypothetical protein